MWWEREREGEETSTLQIIRIQMPSQVSEAEGELGERVALVWIHYELVHADAPCNHLRQMEWRTERGPSNPAGLSGKMYGCPTLLELTPNTYSAHSPCNKARPFGSPSSLSPRALIFQGFFPGEIFFLSPTWPAPGGVPTFHSIPSNDARAEGTCTQPPPPNHQPQRTATCALRYLKRLHSSVRLFPQHVQPRCYFWITTDVWIIPPLKRAVNAIIGYQWQ